MRDAIRFEENGTVCAHIYKLSKITNMLTVIIHLEVQMLDTIQHRQSYLQTNEPHSVV